MKRCFGTGDSTALRLLRHDNQGSGVPQGERTLLGGRMIVKDHIGSKVLPETYKARYHNQPRMPTVCGDGQTTYGRQVCGIEHTLEGYASPLLLTFNSFPHHENDLGLRVRVPP